MTLQQAPDLALTLMDKEKTATTLHRVRGSRTIVIDFWTTKCVRCPACLTKLNEMAKTCEGVLFLSVCMDDLDFGAELVSENDWKTMKHAYASHEEKERAKAFWGFKTVPFVVALAPDGHTAFSGSGVGLTKEKLFSALDTEKENVKIAPNTSNVFQIDDDF